MPLHLVQTRKPERDALVCDNMHLVPKIAKNIGGRVPPCFDLDDLEGPGYLGLAKAGAKFIFKPRPGDKRPAGVRFTAYCRKWIEGSILESVRRRNWREATAPHLEDLAVAGKGDVESNFHSDERYLEDPRQDTAAKVVAMELRREVDRAVSRSVSSEEGKVIQMMYRDDVPLNVVARRTGNTRARTMELHQSGLARLRVALKAAA